jgi:hypothetical protein
LLRQHYANIFKDQFSFLINSQYKPQNYDIQRYQSRIGQSAYKNRWNGPQTLLRIFCAPQRTIFCI